MLSTPQNSPDLEIEFYTELSLWVKPRYNPVCIGESIGVLPSVSLDFG